MLTSQEGCCFGSFPCKEKRSGIATRAVAESLHVLVFIHGPVALVLLVEVEAQLYWRSAGSRTHSPKIVAVCFHGLVYAAAPSLPGLELHMEALHESAS